MSGRVGRGCSAVLFAVDDSWRVGWLAGVGWSGGGTKERRCGGGRGRRVTRALGGHAPVL